MRYIGGDILKRILSTITFSLLLILLSSVFITPIKAQDDKDVKIQQLEANLRLFDEALREISPSTPKETALIWAKGIATRNGAMQYSVLSDRLKEEFRKKMEGQIWVTGTSSPWVIGYALTDTKKVGESYEVTVEFSWGTSAGPAGKTQSKLTILKEGGKWRISEYKDSNI
jgi:hypothetical protein